MISQADFIPFAAQMHSTMLRFLKQDQHADYADLLKTELTQNAILDRI
jgi:hypothetical protein